MTKQELAQKIATLTKQPINEVSQVIEATIITIRET